MTREFKHKLVSYLYIDGEFTPHGLTSLPNWPVLHDIDMDCEDPLDVENFEFLDFNDEEITVCCGGDWQDPHTVVIGLIGGDVCVKDYYESDFHEGYSYDVVEQLFQDLVHTDKTNVKEPKVKTIHDYEKEMWMAVDLENYEEAARIRDIINSMKS